MRDPTLRKQLACRARMLAEQQYSWESVRQRAAELATDLLGDSRSPAPPPGDAQPAEGP